jgi:tRNA-dihydrouridine synthase 1
MVDASDLPYRLLTRRFNTSLCFTPMIHARMFLEKPGYRHKFWKYTGMPAEDRPLIAQFCGNDKDVLLQAMKLVEGQVDGVDINCGCPQQIAKRGGYGAFLLEEKNGDVIVDIVRHLAKHMNVPVSVKVRILPSGLEDSLVLYQRLVDAGAAMLTIHGRTRLQNKVLTGAANWDYIREIVDRFGDRVPIIANGGISNFDDVKRCFEYCGVDGVMSSEAILEYPPLFTETNVISTDYKRTGPGRLQMAVDYLKLCEKYPPQDGGQGSGMKCIRAHLHRFLHADLQAHTEVRDAVVKAFTMEAAWDVVNMIRKIHTNDGHNVSAEQLSWYVRHLNDSERHSGVGRNFDEKKCPTEEEEEDMCCLGRDMFGPVCADESDCDY